MTVKIINVKVGEEFTVPIQSTPTTGYVWEVQSLPQSIQFLDSDFEKPPGSVLPGAQITQVFRFQLLQAGEYPITFVLKRQWESNAAESLTVTVKSN